MTKIDKELKQIERKERFWKGIELTIPIIMLLTSPFFEDAEFHEFLFGGLEGVAIWKLHHLEKQKEDVALGHRRTKPDYSTLPSYASDGFGRRKGTSHVRRRQR